MRANDIGTESFLQHLSKVKRTGADRWIACCPAHDDKTPSLAIRQTADGVVLIRCFAGCAAHEIVAAVGMNLSDLFPPKDYRAVEPGKPIRSPFPAADILRCIQNEALIVAIAAARMTMGEELPPEDYERLKLAAQRITGAYDHG
ncbi:MAG: DNA primase [Proteobacteria bacterium]|nr:DNA primase [Pseudomonadota bacterium]